VTEGRPRRRAYRRAWEGRARTGGQGENAPRPDGSLIDAIEAGGALGPIRHVSTSQRRMAMGRPADRPSWGRCGEL